MKYKCQGISGLLYTAKSNLNLKGFSTIKRSIPFHHHTSTSFGQSDLGIILIFDLLLV
jgi:hypothetical protein